MGTLYKYYLQPAFASLDEKSAQSDTCGVLARGLTEWLSIGTSTASIATMIATIANLIK